MECPRVALFDLDDTLAESFHAPSAEMLAGLYMLLNHIPVGIITGTGFQRMESLFLPALATHPRSDRLYIFPTCSAQCYAHEQGTWKQLYNLALTEAEREHIKHVVGNLAANIDALKDVPHYGEQMVDRGSQIAYTPVGIDAPREVKDSWDIDGSKRRELWQEIQKQLPEFEVLMGGVTTIDITRKDINKSYGVRWLGERLHIPLSDMLYVGDALYQGGNDAVVIPTGIQVHAVSDPAETLKVIQELTAACSA